jgi:hypothetical protein
MNLEASLRRVEGLMKKPMEQSEMAGHGGKVSMELESSRPNGPNAVPLTHEAIHCHSRVNQHPTWVWITKSSTPDSNGRIGFCHTSF